MADANVRRGLAALFLFALWPSLPVTAIDLLRSYEQALLNDGQLKMSRARADAGREALPQATAQMLPNVSFSYSYGHTEQKRTLDNIAEPTQSYPSRSGTLGLRQPLFRMDLLSQYEEAKAKVRGADAQLDTDYQVLGVRVTSAYFDALFARDSLELILLQKAAYEAQLRAAKLTFAAGAGTRTDIDDVQSRYDLILADEIKARQAIAATREQLEVFVGDPISTLSTLDPSRFRADAHDPQTLDQWVARALEFSPELQLLKARYDAALSAVERTKAGHYPSLDLVAQYGNSVGDSTDAFPRTEKDTGYVGVQLSVPIYAGGYINSTVRQASFSAEEARHAYDYARDELRLRVKREFDAVKAGMSRVRALETAVKSTDQVVQSTQKGVQAGTRTTLDVLIVEQQRFNAQIELTKSRYQLLVSWAALQSYVGDLNAEQIARINRVLSEPVPVAM